MKKIILLACSMLLFLLCCSMVFTGDYFLLFAILTGLFVGCFYQREPLWFVVSLLMALLILAVRLSDHGRVFIHARTGIQLSWFNFIRCLLTLGVQLLTAFLSFEVTKYFSAETMPSMEFEQKR